MNVLIDTNIILDIALDLKNILKTPVALHYLLG